MHRLAKEMHDADGDLPRLFRERFAYIEDVNAFVLARVDEALREWTEHEGRPGERRRQRRSNTPKPVAKRQV